MKNLYKLFLILFFASASISGFAQLHVTASPPFYSYICIGGSGQFNASAYGGTTPYHYKWSPSLWLNSDMLQNPTCFPTYMFPHDTTVLYSVVVTDNLGAQDTATLLMPFFKSPIFNLTSSAQNNTICIGMSTTLTANGACNYSYTWSPSGTLSSSTGTSVIATPTTTSTYTVEASNNGCTSTGSIYIIVNNCPYNILHGEVYNDINGNGARDAGEYAMPHYMVNIAPAASVNSYVYDSAYTAYVGPGSYNVTPDNVPYFTQTTNQNITFSGYGTEDTLDVGLHGLPGINDLKVDITSNFYLFNCDSGCLYNFGWYWPWWYFGGLSFYTVHYTNMGTEPLNGVLKIKYDNLTVNFGTSNPSVSGDTVFAVINDTLIWQYYNLMPGEDRYFNASGLDSNAIPGQMHEVIVVGYPIIGDTIPANNYDTCYQTVLGSWDPNFKEVNPAHDITEPQVAAGIPLTYTIHFQNTGNDTAIIVKVRDTISSKLDMATFEMISASHTYTITITGENNIEWKFDHIMLPDSGANQIMSNGYLKYRITPLTTLNEGDSILNHAAIYFDNNTPVITNNAVTHIMLTTAVHEIKETEGFIVYPNPSNGDFSMTVPPSAKQIIVTNSLGQIIQSAKVDKQQSIFDFKIAHSGIYFIEVITDKQTLTKKLIVTSK
jgi:uncharacterized repeat protein (TIGR01451 family)